jgi:hypothetical protein
MHYFSWDLRALKIGIVVFCPVIQCSLVGHQQSSVNVTLKMYTEGSTETLKNNCQATWCLPKE